MIKINYDSSAEKNSALTEIYHYTQDASHRYLAYRDIPDIFSRHVTGKQALDLGVGTGLSSRFLLRQGFEVSGADVSDTMLSQARIQFPEMPLHQLADGRVPVPSSSYDLVFSSFVLFELESKEFITGYLQEAKRLLKKDGVMVAVTGSSHMHSVNRDWFTFRTDYAANAVRQPGQKVKAYHYESGIEFTDYFWPEEIYREIFVSVGLRCIETRHPLGKKEESYAWRDELVASPFVIFILGHT